MGTSINVHDMREGYEVRTSDNQSLGKINEVLVGTGDEGSYLHVQQGLIFKHDLYIPFEQAQRVEGHAVILHLTKDDVSSRAYNVRPSAFREPA
jgi:hypothetical protein